jgi:hypothetical protein
METKLPQAFVLHPEVSHARQAHLPVVALESTVITHGLPRPENLALGRALETEVRGAGAVPATVAFIEGKIHEQYGNFPYVVVLSEVDRQHNSDNFEIINLDLKCSTFIKDILTL